MFPWENFRKFGLHWSVFHVVFMMEKKNKRRSEERVRTKEWEMSVVKEEE